MITAMLVATLLGGADAGSGRTMFNQVVEDNKDQIVKQIQKVKKSTPFETAIAQIGKDLSKGFTEGLKTETVVQSIFLSEGAQKIALVVFKNAKESFALMFVHQDGKIQMVRQDFKELP